MFTVLLLAIAMVVGLYAAAVIARHSVKHQSKAAMVVVHIEPRRRRR